MCVRDGEIMIEMTIEQAIQHCREKDCNTECGREHEQLARWLEELQEYREKYKWISVKDRLPYAEYGESDSVLTISESGIQEVLYFDGSCWCHPTGEVRESVFHITHWMTLPPSQSHKMESD